MTLFCLLAMYFLNFFLVTKAIMLYRRSGGLKGDLTTEDNWEEDLIIFRKYDDPVWIMNIDYKTLDF